MKKIIALVLCAVALFSFVACGGTGAGGDKAPKGEVKDWGNFSVFVPDGFTLDGGLLEDEDTAHLGNSEHVFNYINIYKKDAEGIDADIATTKEINSELGVTDVSAEIGGYTLTGIRYEAIGYVCVCVKGVKGDTTVEIQACGYELESATMKAVLEGLTVK